MWKMFLRVITTLLVLGTIATAVAVVPDLGSVPLDVEFRFQITYLPFIYAAYAGGLAFFLLWKVGNRPGAHELGVLLALMALALALSVVPAGRPTLAHRLGFGAAWWALVLQVIYFWARFPRALELDRVAELARHRGRGVWYDGPNRFGARVVHWTIGSTAGRVLLVLIAGVFAGVLAVPDLTPFNFLAPRMDVGWRYLIVAGPASALHAIITILVAWTSFRMSDETGRRQVLWILMAHLISLFMVVMTTGLMALESVTSSSVLALLERGVLAAFQPVGWAVTLTGYGLALFVSGAFDLRPVIGRSTVYGALVVCLTLLFAVVEELVEAQLATRMDLPDGMGTWVGAASIALFLGPVHAKLTQLMRRFVPDHPEGGVPPGDSR